MKSYIIPFTVTAISFILYILGGEKRLTKAAKLKKFSSLKPWIGVINKKNLYIAHLHRHIGA
jgi:hypothetical protein